MARNLIRIGDIVYDSDTGEHVADFARGKWYEPHEEHPGIVELDVAPDRRQAIYAQLPRNERVHPVDAVRLRAAAKDKR